MGLDLAQLWQQRRWRFLLNIIDQLPGTSRYSEAVANDDDLARAVAAGKVAKPGPARMRLADWSAEVIELRTISERLESVVAAVMAAAGSKRPVRFPARPRPEVAADRVRREAAMTTHRRLVAILIPAEEV